MTLYKIVDRINSEYYFLYHGMCGSKKIMPNYTYTAEQKMVRDGSGQAHYLSGVHAFSTKEAAEIYIKKFRKPNKVILEIEADTIRRKSIHSLAVLSDTVNFKNFKEA